MSRRICNIRKPGMEIYLRPVENSDETLLKEFFNTLSEESLYHRFFTLKKKRIQDRIQHLITNYMFNESTVIAYSDFNGTTSIIGIGQYFFEEHSPRAEVALMVKDDFQQLGIGTELMKCLTDMAKKQGLSELTAEVLAESTTRLHLFEKLGFRVTNRVYAGVYQIQMSLT